MKVDKIIKGYFVQAGVGGEYGPFGQSCFKTFFGLNRIKKTRLKN